jgi:hypothetical protein
MRSCGKTQEDRERLGGDHRLVEVSQTDTDLERTRSKLE